MGELPRGSDIEPGYGSASRVASGSVPQLAAAPEDLRGMSMLVIDDEPINCKVAKKYLGMAGYTNIAVLNDATAAMAMIVRDRPDLILLDIMMPEVSGLDILSQVRADKGVSFTPVLVLTASADDETKRKALGRGATDFLSKPVDVNELLPRVRNALVMKAHQDRLAHYAEELEERVKERTHDLMMTRLEVVHCLGRAAEYRDNDTGNHVVRVGKYAGIIARQMELGAAMVEMLEHAAPLHDVGKIGISDTILLKPGKLSPDEYELMQRHALLGKAVLEPPSEGEAGVWKSHAKLGEKIIGGTEFPLLKLAAKIALTHHEWWDGTGYPLGLKGEDIPIEGRITAVADVFDALSSKRPYKQALPREKCFEIMREGRGKQFDPKVLDAFFECSDAIVMTQIQFAD